MSSYQSDPLMLDSSVNNTPQEHKSGCGSKLVKFIVGAFVLVLVIVLLVVLLRTSVIDEADNYAFRYVLAATTDDEDLVCNDGSPAIYYVRENNENNDKWIIYLEGGFLYCWDEATCADRMEVNPELMTSDLAEDTKLPEGLLSSDCDVNPDYCDYNLGYVFYCSSDYFSGTVNADESGIGYHFQGSKILTATIDTLASEHGLSFASEVLLTGKGGGGVALLQKADEIEAQVRDLLDNGEDAVIRGVVDTGWLSDADPYDEARRTCENATSSALCTLYAGVSRGVGMWQPDYPQKCLDNGLTWECFFGRFIYDLTSTDLLIAGFQYDYAQLDTDGAEALHGGFDDEDLVAYAQDSAENYINNEISPSVATGFFPSCYNHEFIDKDRWADTQIETDTTVGAVNLLTLMRDWEEGTYNLHYDADWTINSNLECPE